jgi:hypothetical protein
MLAHTGNFESARCWCAPTEGGSVLAVPYDIPHSSVAKRQETLGTHILHYPSLPPSLPFCGRYSTPNVRLLLQRWCPAFLSPALATNTSVPRPTRPTRYSPLHPASPPPLLAYKSAASCAQLIACASGYLRRADHGERRDGDGARTRHRLPPGLCAELAVLLCGGGRLGR